MLAFKKGIIEAYIYNNCRVFKNNWKNGICYKFSYFVLVCSTMLMISFKNHMDTYHLYLNLSLGPSTNITFYKNGNSITLPDLLTHEVGWVNWVKFGVLSVPPYLESRLDKSHCSFVDT